jgi:hypothetical protein
VERRTVVAIGAELPGEIAAGAVARPAPGSGRTRNRRD